MKRSQKGCRGCEAKACGASTWEVGYVVGSHYSTAIALQNDPDEEPDIKLCARHRQMAITAGAKTLAWFLRMARPAKDGGST